MRMTLRKDDPFWRQSGILDRIRRQAPRCRSVIVGGHLWTDWAGSLDEDTHDMLVGEGMFYDEARDAWVA